MLGTRELAAVRAALAYWRDEMCPHGMLAMRPYLPPQGMAPLSAAEVDALCDCFIDTAVHYVLLDETRQRLVSREVYLTLPDSFDARVTGQGIAAVIVQPG